MNVQFLKGTQTELNSKTSYQAGAFYLTEDTERLYYAKDSDNLLYLNKYVITVADKTKLPAIAGVNAGDLYYIKNINVLCTKQDSSSTSWTQINTNTDQSYRTTGLDIKSLTINEIKNLSNLGIESGKEDQYLVFGLKVNQKKKDFSNGTESDVTSTEEAAESYLVIPIEDVINNLSVGVTATKATKAADGVDGIKVSTTGAGSDSSKTVVITGDKDATVVSTDKGFSISATPYDIAFTPTTAANDTKSYSIDLKRDGTKKTSIAVVEGLDINFDGSANNSFKINHKGYEYDNTNELPAEQKDITSTFSVITGVDVTNGHITGVKKGTVKLPTFTNTDTRLSGVSFGNDGTMTFNLKDVNGSDLPSIKSGSGLYYTIGGTKYYNQADLSNVIATKADLANLNAMVYRGTLDSQNAYNALQAEDKVKIGDTYLVNVASLEFNTDKQKAKRGDLLIATSANGEQSDGYIAQKDIVWTKVDSSDEVDTQYDLISSGTDIILKASTDLDGSEQDKVTLGTSTVDAINVYGPSNNAINIDHVKPSITETDNTGTATSLSHSGEFLAISNIAVNEYGHITAYTANKYKLPSDSNTTYYITSDSNTSPTQAVLKNSSGTKCGAIKVVGSDTTPISVAVTSSNTSNTTKLSNMTFTVSHSDVAATETQAPETANSLASGGTLTYVKEVKRNAQGHVTEIVRDKVTLFKDTTYTLSGATIASSTSSGATTLTVTDTLTDSNGVTSTSAFSLSSSSLALSANNKKITMNLEWGSF